MKFILKFLFNFDMFSSTAWQHLMRAHLQGFGGFVFGILILAALPLYVATTTIIVRTKKPLLTIPVPKFIHSAFAPPPPPAEPAPESQKTEDSPETFPDNMPPELRDAFRRARRGGIRSQISAFDNSHMLNITEPVLEPSLNTSTTTDTAEDFPLPTAFDFSDTADTSAQSVPSFTDITFDSAPTDTKTSDTSSPIIENLPSAKSEGDFIIYNKNIIAVHDDPDFWIADDTDWFASGKQHPNPTIALKQRASETGLTPVLYLVETNILDLDAKIEQWRNDGITVITNLDDLK